MPGDFSFPPFMSSHVSRFLHRLLEDRQRSSPQYTPNALARELGISTSSLTRMLNPEPVGLQRETLDRVIREISSDPAEQSQFLAAYLRDQKAGPTAVQSAVEIVISNETLIAEDPADFRQSLEAHLAPRLAADIEKITKAAAQNESFRRAMSSLAKVAEDLLRPHSDRA